MSTQAREVLEELRGVLAGRSALVDTLIPPAVFLGVVPLGGLVWAASAAFGLAAVLGVWRVARGASPWYAALGLAGAALAAGAVALAGRAEGLVLPDVLIGVLSALACLLSVLARRPLVALTSRLVRRWPAGWYRHPAVAPAYALTTLAWAVFFAARALAQVLLAGTGTTAGLAVAAIALGWPATLVLLVGTYLYGLWRLRGLGGPSVEEWSGGAPPPWRGQRRGF